MDLSGYDGQAAPAVILLATPDQEVGGPGYHGGVAGEFGFKDHALEEAVGVFPGEEHGASAGAPVATCATVRGLQAAGLGGASSSTVKPRPERLMSRGRTSRLKRRASFSTVRGV